MPEVIENDIPAHLEFDADLSSMDAILDDLPSDAVLENGYPFMRSGDAVRQAIDEAAMTADFIIVTRGSDINRNGHMCQIAPGADGEGFKLDNYANNPVVYFDHGYGFNIPIAKSSLPKLTKKHATATATFSQVLPEAAIFFGLIAEGILNTASVSFLPLKAKRFKAKQLDKLKEDEEDFRPWMSYDFLTSELLEWSVVGVPADPGAIRKCLDRRSVNGYRITQRLIAPLEKMSGPKPEMSGPGPEELKRERLQLQKLRASLDLKSDALNEIETRARAAQASLVATAIKDAFAPLQQAVEASGKRLDAIAATSGLKK